MLYLVDLLFRVCKESRKVTQSITVQHNLSLFISSCHDVPHRSQRCRLKTQTNFSLDFSHFDEHSSRSKLLFVRHRSSFNSSQGKPYLTFLLALNTQNDKEYKRLCHTWTFTSWWLSNGTRYGTIPESMTIWICSLPASVRYDRAHTVSTRIYTQHKSSPLHSHVAYRVSCLWSFWMVIFLCSLLCFNAFHLKKIITQTQCSIVCPPLTYTEIGVCVYVTLTLTSVWWMSTHSAGRICMRHSHDVTHTHFCHHLFSYIT